MQPRDAETNAQHANIAIPEISRVQDSSRTNGHSHLSQTIKRPAIVVIHPRAFFRDCFVRCLEISYKTHEVFAFETISTWQEAGDQDAVEPAIIVFFAESNNPSCSIDLQSLEAVAAGIPVVIMSDSDDVNYVTRALKGGARGYIPTSLPFNVAVEAVRLVEAGGTFVPVTSLDLNRDKLGATTTRANDLLTQRQLMVVEALCQGMANKQIAYELSMSEHTVKVHLRHIMRKLNARNRTEVAVLTKDFF
ncbi:LuxR C-terminal-related transcriptional regulator [Bradyrhizobium sp. SYSU BS000235]|uniref:LuxR C-terminal-related transcriptional regulator n=1 Tax=Bradyrhizobium sp. SYSU BS000235 TaxID=3411332 RepID=UPI003C70626A